MNNFIIVFVVLMFLAVTLISISYFYIEKPKQEQSLEYNTINLKVINNLGSQIPANYWILSDGVVMANGTTLVKGYIKDQILVNKTFSIFVDGENISSNLTYYPIGTGIHNVEATLKVYKIGNVTASIQGDLTSFLFINILSDTPLFNKLVCFRWSPNVITVSLDKLQKVDAPSRLKVDKCYELSIPNNYTSFPVNYRIYERGPRDFIKIYILNGDYSIDNLNEIKYEKAGKPIKIPDIELNIE
jgi:hypothetical protein